MHASEAQHAVGPEDLRMRKPAGTARLHFVPTAEEVAHRIVDMVVHGPVGHQARAVAKVRRPTALDRVEPAADFGPRLEVARDQNLSDLGLEPPDALLRRACSQVPITILAMVVRSERVAKEVEVLRAGIPQL